MQKQELFIKGVEQKEKYTLVQTGLRDRETTCKECETKNRANGSSRCDECSKKHRVLLYNGERLRRKVEEQVKN